MSKSTGEPASRPPILAAKHVDSPSVFAPESLLREARRQKGLPDARVPGICILDPDGDLVRNLVASQRAVRDRLWACYHTDLHLFSHAGIDYGVIGCAVGAPFAVLVAEQLFASGCRLLVSMTSAGQILPVQDPPYFILIDRALRDEGTSYHYLPPSDYSDADPALLGLMESAFSQIGASVRRGATWTTDAPFRETNEAVEACKAEGILAVEMEAAALYAFSRARRKPLLCFAHVTNRMGQIDGDFEKGEADGTDRSLAVISAAARRWLESDAPPEP